MALSMCLGIFLPLSRGKYAIYKNGFVNDTIHKRVQIIELLFENMWRVKNGDTKARRYLISIGWFNETRIFIMKNLQT